jgi:hypothetical protein
MEVGGLPNARPISCKDCPAFQRRQMSVLCVQEGRARFPWVIDTSLDFLDGVALTHCIHPAYRELI